MTYNIDYTHKWVFPDSDAIHAVYFNENTNVGYIDFESSYVYSKGGTTLNAVRGFATAESAGGYYNDHKHDYFSNLSYLGHRSNCTFNQVAPESLADSGTPKGLTVTDSTITTSAASTSTYTGLSSGTIINSSGNATYVVPVTVPSDWKGHWSVGFVLDGSADEKEFEAFDSSTADEAVQELLDVSARVGVKVETIKWVRFDFDK
jgi:hypothetical protein